MYKRLKVKLYPTKNQIEMLENHFDGYRFAYNLSLEYKQHLWKYHKINISGFDLLRKNYRYDRFKRGSHLVCRHYWSF